MLPQSSKQWSCTKTTWQSFTSSLTGSISREINLALMSDAIPFDHLHCCYFLFIYFSFPKKWNIKTCLCAHLEGSGWAVTGADREGLCRRQVDRLTVLGSARCWAAGDTPPLPSSAMSCTGTSCHWKTEVKGLLPGKGQNSHGETVSKTYFRKDRWEERGKEGQRESLEEAKSILVLQVQPLSLQINHYILWGIIYYQLRQATDSISSMFWLSCPMPQSVISLHLCQWASSVKAIIMVTNCPPTNESWQHTCKQGDG